MKRTPIKWPAADADDRVYWRSLDQLADTTEFREFLNREFQDGAAELKSPLGRRSFMSLMGASLALAGLSGCRRPEENILPYTKAPEDMVMGLPTYYATAIPVGSAVYGVLVESNEGRPTKIEGNPLHPMSLGATNSYVQASILELYDPDRSASPMLQGRDHEEVVAPLHTVAHGAEPAHGEAAPEGHGEEHEGHGAAAPKIRVFDSNDALGFLRGRRDKAAAQRGKGLHVLSGALTSPTLLRLREQLKTEQPEARWSTWEADCEDNVRAGSRLAFGDDLVSLPNFQKADVILALDSDFLYGTGQAVRSARHFAGRRRVSGPADGMNRLYVAESAWTVTGTNADHRLRARPSEVTLLAAALATKLAALGMAMPAPVPDLVAALPKGPAVDEKFLNAVAEDLKKAGPRALITVGPNQPKEVHALVHALHAALGAAGETVTYAKAADAGRALDLDSLKELAAALDKGEVETLVVLGANPVYDAPADLKLGEKFAKATVVHLGCYRDETAKAAALHIPRAHTLEAWGDVRSADGTASIVQPLIAPLYKGCSDIELVNYLLTGKMTRGYELVRETWRGVAVARMPAPPAPPPPVEVAPPVPAKGGKKPVGGAAHKLVNNVPAAAAVVAAAPAPAAPAPVAAPPPGVPSAPVLFFERFWRKALHDGVIEGTAFETVKPMLKAELAPALGKLAALKPRPMEVQFLVDNTVFDGRFANNGWLQELPDPVTKMVWDNAAILSLDTAKQLGVDKDDMVRITVRGQSVDAAVFVQPGQASSTVSIALGYGRKEVGRVGKGAGFDVYPLRNSDALGSDAAEVVKLGSKYADARDDWFGDIVKLTGLVTTQDHFALEGRPLVREASLTRFKQRPDFAKHKVHLPPLLALWDDYKLTGQQWGMTIDLGACVGCGACTTACQAENNIPIVGKPQVRKGREMHWIRIDRYFSFQHQSDLTDDNTEVTHQPIPCMQCENAPCENVCPVAATVHSGDGLNDMVYNRCVGTRYCANNCPWKVRRFNFLDWRGDVEEVQKLTYNPDVTLRARGVMEKCTYCVQRIRGAQRDAKLKTGSEHVEDQRIVTACQQVCPAEAITFGDIADASTKVSQAKKSPRNYEMLAELNTRPRTSFLARVRNPNPALYSEPAEAHEEGEHGGAAAAHGAEHGAANDLKKEHEAGASHP